MKTNYKIIVCYDGTRYNGWQKQGNTEETIQGKLENVIGRMTGEITEVTGAGRTDAGVHALGQTANFFAEPDRTAEEIREYLNEYLPEDIAVRSVSEVSPRFHSRYCTSGKIYRYAAAKEKSENLFRRRYMWQYYEFCRDRGRSAKLSVSAMRSASECLIGTHDFRSFCGDRHRKKPTVRTVRRIDIEEDESTVVMTFEGDGFLPYMVRIMAGTLIETGSGMRDPGDLKKILEGKDRSLAGMTAPACGLTLAEVLYENDGSVFLKEPL